MGASRSLYASMAKSSVLLIQVYPSPRGHLAGPALQLRADLRHRPHLSPVSHNDDEVRTERPDSRRAPESLPDDPLEPVSHDGFADLPTDGNPQTREAETVRRRDQEKAGTVKTPPSANSRLKGQPSPNPVSTPKEKTLQGRLQTDRRLRPFERRRFKTSCPPGVRIRTLKPCVFFRRWLLG
jgi:hypothetical protein